MHRSTSGTRRACAVGTTIALVGLTTGLGVFGVQAASADTLTDTTTATAAATAPATPSTDQPSPSSSASPTASATPTDAPTATAGTAAPAPSSTPSHHPAATPSAPRATDPSSTASPAVPTPVAAPTVTLSTTAPTVGKPLTATVTGFTGTPTFTWTNSAGTTLQTGTSASFVPSAAENGTTITVTAEDTDGDSATVTSAAVTAPAEFSEHTSQSDPLELSVVAGQSLSHVFSAAGDPTPTYSVGWFYQDDADAAADDPTYTPDTQLPDHTTLSADGTLSGTPEFATTYDFTVVADNGSGTSTEYVEVNVEAAAAYGVEVYTTDKGKIDDDTTTSWIIDPDGHISTEVDTVVEQDPDGSTWAVGTITDGGTPTIHQGGTLVVAGGLVDQYGNEVDEADGTFVEPTVTSDYASDVVKADDGLGGTDVTFPHASTHHLTVSADAFSTAFPVEVVPNAATVAAITPTATTATGELAFTGSETTRALPWALGLLMAGLGVTGLRIARRRTQR
ncbi:hypothetical protein [Curtobacterium sp. MCBD17_003]|uniref:hypothetical protein n=1 Tax=Curtobacterium sp. MCBD17_003 TaxID=2175667 RepID=UPI000DAA6186|nr:hypothetical protein [Curtobacterium sp. MCBD17_003]WIE54319.1 hypothetical protein DEI88_014550 [Curtobacterium sp. MCBD17_003]